MAVKVDNCCGCFNLKTGCLIIGYFGLLSSLYHICSSLFGILKADSVMRENSSVPHNNVWTAANDQLLTSSGQLVSSLLELLFSSLLLLGLNKNKRGYVKANLIYNCVILFIYVIIIASNLVSGSLTSEIAIIYLLAICLAVYFLLVIRSYYIDMGKENTLYDEKDVVDESA